MNNLLLERIKSYNIKTLYKLIYTDHLTGIMNRRAFDECGLFDTIAIVDIDYLKYINDTMGYRQGDEAIKDVARTLTGVFDRENVYRIGGDEFVVTNPNNSDMTACQKKLNIFSFGLDTSLTNADTRMKHNKKIRKQCRPV